MENNVLHRKSEDTNTADIFARFLRTLIQYNQQLYALSFIVVRNMSNTLRAASLGLLCAVLLERGTAPTVSATSPNVCGLGRLGRDLARRTSLGETARIGEAYFGGR